MNHIRGNKLYGHSITGVDMYLCRSKLKTTRINMDQAVNRFGRRKWYRDKKNQ
ncbi:MAG: hypothetical protein ACYDH1_18930 [Anaerolineaceae bacterium]